MSHRSTPVVIAALAVLACSEGDRAPAPAPETTPAHLVPEVRRQLEELGYLVATDPAPLRSGVTLHDRTRAYPGLNLYVTMYGEEATLIDMNGATVHVWKHQSEPLARRGPDPEQKAGLPHWWRTVRLDPEGGLLAQIDYGPLIIETQPGRAFEITETGQVVWEFRNPKNLGKQVAFLNDVVRIPASFAGEVFFGPDAE